MAMSQDFCLLRTGYCLFGLIVLSCHVWLSSEGTASQLSRMAHAEVGGFSMRGFNKARHSTESVDERLMYMPTIDQLWRHLPSQSNCSSGLGGFTHFFREWCIET